ncbi:AraC family transcriptional regulator [Pedosphaera parvula]|uniref:Transcriptional regulator, AraC family n=1 Tax=Pedosphaera parvula (strain Ellin514) TaxID=320771 RepID=B9XHR2_PEDPL|nr:AraC family transcriptional regulator [Pedosphaera parvula]EEF60640.1 transcriptional regulator, AraC family [Pedosphaera parvula Ellin514]
MDVLADIMSLLRTSTHLYGKLDLSAPFGFKFPGEKGICIIVLRGSCFLGVDKESLVPLVGGDFVLLPAPKFYSLRSSPKLPLRPVEQITSEKEFHRTRLISFDGGEGPPTTLVAGCFTFSSPESELLVKHLPPIIHLQASGNRATPWFHSTLQFIAAEAAQNLPGGTAIVDRLAEVLFVLAMRTRTDSFSSANPSWLRALTDPQIGEALRQMHAEPGRPWTVSDLARTVSMSRSSFADRFRELVGETPLGHLTQWRMVRAANMMCSNRPMKMAAIASAVGYESESSFGKVFRRVMGISPGKYRLTKQIDQSTPIQGTGLSCEPWGS